MGFEFIIVILNSITNCLVILDLQLVELVAKKNFIKKVFIFKFKVK
jgi:hypothetical protein